MSHQTRDSSLPGSAKASMKVMQAHATELTTTPASRMDTPPARPARTRAQTIAVAAAPPAKAAAGTAAASMNVAAPRPDAMATVAPRAAPPETPSTYGSASGFLRVPWNAAPTPAKPAPATTPSRTRGKR